jgi:hypothetical protein
MHLIRYILIFAITITSACKTRSVDEPQSAVEQSDVELTVEQRMVDDFSDAPHGKINFCSFNISFLGHWKEKKNQELAKFLNRCHIVAVQELVGTPITLNFPDKRLLPDQEAKAFVQAMAQHGFRYRISPENSGRTTNRVNTTAAEFTAVFYKTQYIGLGAFGPNGPVPEEFVSMPLVANPIFDRVPYAIPMHVIKPDGTRGNDFVLLSVHLHAGSQESSTSDEVSRRNGEIKVLMQWAEKIKAQYGEEDFIIVGDMNIRHRSELDALFAEDNTLGWTTLNMDSLPSNLILSRPYNQVLYPRGGSKHFNMLTKMKVVDLGKKFNIENYESKQQFVKEYSDHCPIYFHYNISSDDD